MEWHGRERPLLTVRLLGGFDLQQNEMPVHTLNSPRMQALLTYLILHRHAPQSRQYVAFLFWPDSDERQAKANLRKLLHQLRQALPDACRFLMSDASSLRWRPAAPFTLDVANFQSLLERAGAAEAEGKWQASRDALEQAVALYRGELLPGCYDPWLVPRREALYQAYLNGLERLTQLLEDGGQYQKAILYARHLLQQEPLRELVYRRLMRLHALRGDRAAALATYRQCAAQLQQELGVEPAHATQRLRERLLATGASRGSSVLPTPASSFVGRADELAMVVRRLKDPDCRLLTITGPGGVGKTRLALEAARRVAAAPGVRFLDGACFVSLAAVSSPDLLIPAIAGALPFRFYGRQSPQEQLFDYLRGKEMLLLLDSFEQIHVATPLLSAMLEHAPGLKLLVTSRVRLQLHEEWLLQLDGLPFPQREQAPHEPADNRDRTGTDDAFAAVQLFCQRAKQVDAAFSAGKEHRHVVHICRLVGGLPLALELAAAWLPSLSCAQIAGEIEQGLDLLSATVRNLPQRHRSMRAVFDHSWRLLSDGEKALFRRLAIFPSHFNMEAAREVAGASAPLLDRLVARSFLRQAQPGRYEIHPLLRKYGAERLAEEQAEQARVSNEHCRYYTHFLAQRERKLHDHQQKQAMLAVGAELDNIRTAWHRATARRQWKHLKDMLRSAIRFFTMSSRFEEGVALLEQAIGPMRGQEADTGDESRQQLLVRLLAHRGGLLDRLGRYEQARADLDESLQKARAFNDRPAMVDALNNLGVVAHHQNNYEEAEQHLQASLIIGRELGDERRIARTLTSLGLLSRDAGNYERATQQLTESLTIQRRLGDPFALAGVVNNLGIVAGTVGDYDTAQRRFEECLAIRRELDERWGSALVLNNLGVLAQLRQSYTEARQWLEESLAIRREIGNRWAVAITLNNLGLVVLEEEQHEEARAYLEESLHIRRALDDQWGVASTRANLGQLLLALDETEAAQAHFMATLCLAMDIGARPLALAAVLGMARILSRRGKQDRALQLASFVRHHPAADQKAQDGAVDLFAELKARGNDSVVQSEPAPLADMSLDELVGALRENTI